MERIRRNGSAPRGAREARAAHAALAGFVAGGALLLFAAAAWAGSVERMGTNAASELLIGVGARSDALGGNAVADVTGPEAMYWNPAGLGGLKNTEATFTHIRNIGGTNVSYVAIVTRASEFGTLGFSAKVLDVGDIAVTTELAPEGTGEILSPTFATLGVTYARQFTDRVSFGATAQLVNERIQDAQARGLALDFGFQYDTGPSGLKFGFVMKNFGPSMSFTGPAFEINVPDPSAEPGSSNRTLRFSSGQNELPSYFQIGASYRAWSQNDNQLNLLGTFTSNNFTPDDLRAGAEMIVHRRLALRAGYNRFTSDSDRNVFQGPSFGAGFKFKAGNSQMEFDYAQRVVRNFFDDTHEFGLKVDF